LIAVKYVINIFPLGQDQSHPTAINKVKRVELVIGKKRQNGVEEKIPKRGPINKLYFQKFDSLFTETEK
jgi:hypothetical protein